LDLLSNQELNRNAAIKMGPTGAMTLLFKDDKFVMVCTNYDSLAKEPHIVRLLVEKLRPEDGDVIIIGSATENQRQQNLLQRMLHF
jgi:hypothetical protein